MWNNREGWRLRQIDNERGREGKGKSGGGRDRERRETERRETETPQRESPGYLIIQSPALELPQLTVSRADASSPCQTLH